MTATLVFRVEEDEGRRLYEVLGSGPYAFRPLPHARWSASGEGVRVTLYRSGKLVVQGAGAGAFAERYLPGRDADGPPTSPGDVLDRAAIGSDESGKGDYFGPLVVAAALVRPADVDDLRALGVRDSKRAPDGLVRRLEGVLAERLPHAVTVLSPEAYNRAWDDERNVNRLLGRLHAGVLEEVLGGAGGKDVALVVDRFGAPEHVRRHLGADARARPLQMRPEGERHPAVAAASFLARAAFLRGLGRLEGMAGEPLPRGSSDPRVLATARRLLAEGGEPWLARFAKVHFRITRRARAAPPE